MSENTPTSLAGKYTLQQKIVFVECINAYAQLLINVDGGLLNKRGTYFLVVEVCKRYYDNNPITIREAHHVMRQEGKPAYDRINALEEAGYLVRQRHPRDRRKLVLCPTDKLEALFDCITSEGLSIFLRAAERIYVLPTADDETHLPSSLVV